tara:strand:+ start:402075 stop:403310 length:1236 start_codon:yes stop_codon:yes gene_type:complete
MPTKKTNRDKMTRGKPPFVSSLLAFVKMNFSPKVFFITLCLGLAAATGGGFALYNTVRAPDVTAWPYVEIKIEHATNFVDSQPPQTTNEDPNDPYDHSTPLTTAAVAAEGQEAHSANDLSGGEPFMAEYSTEADDRYVIDLSHNKKLFDTIDDNIIVPRRSGADTVFQAYSSPLFTDVKSAPYKGVISLVMVDYGLSANITNQADMAFKDIHLSYALSPYAESPQMQLDNARKNGHEVWLSLPLQAKNFPWVETGPTTLLIDSKPDENRKKLIWLLSLARGYPGVISVNESVYETSESDTSLLFSALYQHGVGYVNANPSAPSISREIAQIQKIPFEQSKLWLTTPQSIEALSAKLLDVENMALNSQKDESIIAFFHPHPKAIERIAQWAKKVSVEKNIAIVPLSFQVTAP